MLLSWKPISIGNNNFWFRQGNCVIKIAPKISKYLNDINYEICVDLKSAVQNSLDQAKPNDIVLFSPGTSSFDQFKSYIERGKSFNSYVRQFT